MQKIISLFCRNYDGDRLVRDEVVPGAEWVVSGEGIATRKWDGTCCLVRDGKLFKRYDLPLKKEWANKKKRGYSGPWTPEMYVAPSAGWERAEEEPDQNSGHWPGWLPVGNGPEDQWFREAWANQNFDRADSQPVRLPNATYELCGPRVQGNPEAEYVLSEVGPGKHLLIPHGRFILGDCPRTFEGVREWLRTRDIEGIVWHHEDGHMVKIKKKDFGLPRKP